MGTAKPQHRVPRIIGAPFVLAVEFLRTGWVPSAAAGKGQRKEKRTGKTVAFVDGKGEEEAEKDREGKGNVGARQQRRSSMVGEERKGGELFKC